MFVLDIVWDSSCLCFNGIESVKESIKRGIEDTKSVENIKVSKILEEMYKDEISCYLGLLHISNEVSFTSLSRFSSISIIELY